MVDNNNLSIVEHEDHVEIAIAPSGVAKLTADEVEQLTNRLTQWLMEGPARDEVDTAADVV